MTTATLPTVATSRASVFAQLTVFAALLLATSLVWSQVDPRTIDGTPVWLKPAKFSLSFTVHFATLALIVAALSAKAQSRRSIAIAGGVMAAAFLGEMAYLFFQAAQAEHSHFNVGSTFHLVMYQLMGVGAVLLIGMPLVVANVARKDTTLGPATRSGIWWGAWVSFALTLIVAGYLSNQGGHFVGTQTDPGRVLPFVGWSTETGDLRPAHFLSLHALQALPLLGIWVDRAERRQTIIPWAAAAYAMLTLVVFAQALMGLPLVAM